MPGKPFLPPDVPARAPHVQAALARAAQPRFPDRSSQPGAPPGRPPQVPAPSGPPPLAAHVRRALAPLQAKRPEPSLPASPARHPIPAAQAKLPSALPPRRASFPAGRGVVQRLAIPNSDWEEWVKEIVKSPVSNVALADIRHRCEGSTASAKDAKSLLQEWYDGFKNLSQSAQAAVHEREMGIQAGMRAAWRGVEEKDDDVGKSKQKPTRKRKTLSSADESAPEGEAKANDGVRVMGALTPSQIQQIVGWGNKQGENGDLDQLADEIFALKKAQGGVKKLKTVLSSQVTGAIAVTKKKSADKTVIYLAQQSGKTMRDMESINELLAPKGYVAVAMDTVSGSPLHAEMTIVANMLLGGSRWISW